MFLIFECSLQFRLSPGHLESGLVCVDHFNRPPFVHAGKKSDTWFDRNVGVRQATVRHKKSRIQLEKQNLLWALSGFGGEVSTDNGDAQNPEHAEAERIERSQRIGIRQRRKPDGGVDKGEAGAESSDGRGSRFSRCRHKFSGHRRVRGIRLRRAVRHPDDRFNVR